MNSNYISTQSLYDSGEHLSHARTYSHKYIKREPDGHGGFRYYYKTDLSLGGRQNNMASRESKRSGAYLYDGQPMNFGTTTPKIARQAQKASEIYREGQSQNAKDYQSRIDQAFKETKPNVSKEYQEALEANSQKNNYFGQGSNPGVVSYPSSTSKPEKKTIGDYAKQAIDTISTAAGSAYDKGKNFLKNLFK